MIYKDVEDTTMTRGTIAFVDYDEERKSWYLCVSEEFNGDMGPTMACGKRLLQYFKEIYFSEKGYLAGSGKILSIIRRMMDDFNHKYSNSGTSNLYGIKEFNLDETDPCIDLTQMKNQSGEIDYDVDGWSKYFHYSDWVYLINVSNKTDSVIVCRDAIKKDDNTYNFYLQPDEVVIFNFRDLVGTFSEQNHFSFDLAARKTQIPQDNLAKENERHNDRHEETKKYVEIISQYRDGNIDCLVVRTNDNRHVIFKEMQNH